MISDQTLELLHSAALAVSGAEGPQVLEELARYAGAILHADAAMIAVYDEARPGHMRTLAACMDGQPLDNFSYPLEGSPCALVVGRSFYFLAGEARNTYPADSMFVSLGFDSYAAFPLNDSAGHALGLIAVMRRLPMNDAHLAEAMLKILAVRAAAEIERTRSEAQRAQMEAQLLQAQKMEAIGQLAGGIAHDFNNLLTSIMGYIVLAGERSQAREDRKLVDYLERAELSCNRARDLIQQMLTFSRGQRGQPRPLDVAARIAEAMRLLRSSLPAMVTLSTNGVEAGLPPVLIDPVQFDQVLLNLCINARDAMQDSGHIEIGARRIDVAEAICASCHQSLSGTYLEVAVADDGPGIDAEVLSRMFEPFYTTKDVGKGSGMGLATVHGIVHRQGGHVVVETGPGRGARFRVLYALSEQAVDEAPPEKSRSAIPRETLNGHVLVVEDEGAVAEYMRDLLMIWGLQVTLANDGRLACEAIAEQPDRYDIVLTDFTMPHMTGLQLAQELAALNPALPVILYTGRGDVIDETALAQAGVRATLGKPVEPARLLALLQRHLNRAE